MRGKSPGLDPNCFLARQIEDALQIAISSNPKTAAPDRPQIAATKPSN
jgi:hypothetical protein